MVATVTDRATGVVTASGFDGVLPAPRLEGRRAVYADVRPGMDLVVEATSTGFEEFFVLDDVGAVDALIGTELSLAASAEGIVEERVGGVLAVTGREGQVAASSGTPLMWDAAADTAREHPLTVERPAEPAGAGVLSPMPDWDDPDQGTEGPAGPVEPAAASVDLELVADPLALAAPVAREVTVVGGDAVVRLVPDEGFLTDPGTVFPVVVDPSVNIKVGFDTYVQSGNTYDSSTATEIRLGTYDGGATVARSFLQFNTAAIAGKVVSAARLDLYAFHSWSCSARNWQVWHTNSVSSATRWTSQPLWRSLQATSSATAGYSASCPDAWANVDVKNIVAAGAANSDAQLTLGLRAENEGDSAGWRRFYSADNGAYAPSLWVTYNSYPASPGVVYLGKDEPSWWTDPATGARTLYVKVARPTFSALVSDPDGGSVRAQFSLLNGAATVWDKLAGSVVASGGRSAYTPTSATPALTDGQTYTARVWAHDGALSSQSYYQPWSFIVDLTDPTTPTVTSSAYPSDGAWLDTPPGSNTFTFTSPSTDVVRFEYSLDGASGSSVTANTSAAGRTANAMVNPGPGAHTLKVEAYDKAGRVSGVATFAFGSGAATLTAPTGGAKSTDTFMASASAPAATGATDTVTPALYWRPAGTADAPGWDPTTGSAQGWTLAQTLPAEAAGTPVNVSTTFSAGAAATAMGQTRTPALIDVQVCFTYTGITAPRCTWVGEDPADPSHVSVLRVPHAFGEAFPEAGAGPGKVALWTGEFSTAATDVAIPTPKDTLSLSRTYASFAGPTTTAPAGVFGPGWVANLDGSDFGSAGYEVVDSTGVDGTIALMDGDGQALVYRQPDGTNTAGKPGVYTAVDDETAAVGARLEVTPAAAALTLTEDDGTVTTWSHPRSADPDDPAETVDPDRWVVGSVTQAGQVGTTTFARDGQGRITRITAPAPDGVTCPVDGTLPAGCRALRLDYATATTATTAAPGDYTGRLVRVFYEAYDPDKPGGPGIETTLVAAYAYTIAGYLATASDPRTGRSTRYTYNPVPAGLAVPQLATLTPPGLATWHLDYAETPQGNHGLARVARDPATGTGAPLPQAAFVYGLTPTGTAGLPSLDATTVTGWGQATAPTWGAAVFGPDHPVTTTSPDDVAAGDWPHAELQYTDAQGRVVNTASFGAGDWQVTATDYDPGGRVVRTLDERAVAQIRDILADGGSVDPDSYATITRYNPAITATAPITHDGGTIAAGTVLTPAGTLVTDVWEPAAPAGATGEVVRVHTRTDYDQGAPNGGVNPATGLPYRLPTTVTTTIAAPGAGSPDPADPLPTGEEVTAQTRTGYDPIDAAAATGPTSGWTLALPTTTTTVMGGGQGDITTRVGYNTAGQTVETRQPQSTGADAGTTRTTYYTTGAHPTDPACGTRPEYAGLPCTTGTGEATPTIATTRTEAYNLYLSPRVVTETLGTAVRTTTTTYTVDGAVDTTATSTAGVPGSTPVPATRTEYAPTTGLPTATIALTGGTETGRITTGHDNWGRVTSYTDIDGQTTTTSYTPAGQVDTVADPTGTTTYAYDGTDATGTAEHRGLPTAMTVTNPGQPALTLTAAYDPGGAMTLQTLPGDIHQHHAYDRAGQLTGLVYSGQSPEGRTDWYAFTLTRDADGDIIADTAPGRARTFTIDRADRLTAVTDTIAPGDGTPGACTTRAYGFDTNGNRTTLATETAEPGQPCPTAPGVTRTWAHDAADRVQAGANTTGTYTYDPLGRQTTIPATDTPAGETAGDLTLGYYDTDLLKATTQNGTTTTYQLDPTARRSTTTVETTDGNTTTVRHYGDTTDNPTWATTTDAGTTTTSRYVTGLAGGLALEITDTQAAITVTDPHGTIATTIAVPNTNTYATQPTTWQRADEYGNSLTTQTTATSTGALTYAWHGKDERATDTTGLTLLGARLYNPTTGLFTSRDPIPGGNTTTYTYPQDPINNHDLDGKRKSCRGWKKWACGVGRVAGIASSITAWCWLPQCQAATLALGAVSAGAYMLGGNRRSAGNALKGTIANMALGGIGRIGKLGYRLPQRSSAVARLASGGLHGAAWQRRGSGMRVRRAAVVTSWLTMNATPILWNVNSRSRR